MDKKQPRGVAFSTPIFDLLNLFEVADINWGTLSNWLNRRITDLPEKQKFTGSGTVRRFSASDLIFFDVTKKVADLGVPLLEASKIGQLARHRAYQRMNRLPPDGGKTGLIMNCFPKPYPNPDNEWVSANHYEEDDTSKLPEHPPIFLVVAIDVLISDTIGKTIKILDEREERGRRQGKFKFDPAISRAVRETLDPVQKSLQ